MPPVEDALSALADHPPSPPTPVAQIRRRASRRVRRRQVATGAVVVVAVLAAGFGVVQVATGDPADEIRADGGTTTQPLTTTTAPTSTDPTTSTTLPEESLTLEPADGLVDGSEVRMALDEPATGEAIVAQCTSEVAEIDPGDLDEVQRWCTGITYTQADALAPYTLRRVVETATGPVDCAEPGRCVLAVRVGGPTGPDDRFAVLRFRPDLGPVPEAEVVVDGDDGTVGDGDQLLLTFAGVQTGQPISVAQCRPGATPDEPQCSSARSLSVTVQGGPETQLSFTAFHDIFVDRDDGDGYDPGWRACEPCELFVSVGDRQLPLARLPLAMEPTAMAIRPVVTVEPDGAAAPGAALSVRATGLQPRSLVLVGWCPTSRSEGGGDSACAPVEGLGGDGLPVADDGTLSIPRFVVPADGRTYPEADCTVAGQCGVGLDAGDAFSVMAIAPIELTG